MTILEGLGRYWAGVVICTAAVASVTYNYLDNRRIENSQQAFRNAIDLNHDGTIDENEEIEVYRKLGLEPKCQHPRTDHEPSLTDVSRAMREYGVLEPIF